MKAGVSILPCGVSTRPRRASPSRATSSKGSFGTVVRLSWKARSGLGRAAAVEIDHLDLDPLRQVELEPGRGDRPVPLQIREAILGEVAVRLDVAHVDGQKERAIDPERHRGEPLLDP